MLNRLPLFTCSLLLAACASTQAPSSPTALHASPDEPILAFVEIGGVT